MADNSQEKTQFIYEFVLLLRSIWFFLLVITFENALSSMDEVKHAKAI